jgi:hypothetical protein
VTTRPRRQASAPGNPPGKTHIATWVSASAGLVSAIVAPTALIVHWSSGDGAKPAAATAATATTLPVSTSTVGSADGTVTLDVVSFLAASPSGPAYRFHGRARLKPGESVYVVARPVDATANSPTNWISSPAVTPARDGSWQTYITRPPLDQRSFDFSAIVLSSHVNVFGTPQSVCPPERSVAQRGPEACGVVAATRIGHYEG